MICRNFSFLLALAIATSFSLVAHSFDTVLYGASYYHEYMPEERLDKDIELMKQANITVIRLGESTWSSWEPRDGHFEYAWMERILDKLHGAGIKVLLGTTTYSIPPWLYQKHPEILVTRLGGQKATYGIRQNMDITHPAYLFHAERVIRKVVSHFKDHPAIIGFQVDNETTSYGTAGPNVQTAFRKHLEARFKTVDALNKAWGFVYWGQLLNSFDELPPADGAINPGYKVEWQRYQQKITTDFLAWQAAIVREYAKPEHFVTHNFVGGVRTDIDEFAIAKHLDVTAVNPYHDVQDGLDGHSISLSGDLCRSLKQRNYLITETNAQTIGWDSKGQFPPYDGQLRLNAYSHIASGANMVAYWHWHSLHYGQETYWKGVLGHDLEPNRIYREASRVGAEWKALGPRLVNFQRKNDVAILYSIDSHHGIQAMPFDDRVNYLTVLHQMHRALFNLNVGVDFVFPDTEDFSKYKVLLVPPLYVASDALLQRLSDYVRNGGHVVMSFKSGFTDENSQVRHSRMPGPLREAAGFSYQEFSTLKEALPLKGDPYRAGAGNRVSVWAEMLLPDTAKPLATYQHPFFGQFPAITRNSFGTGTLTYEGTYLSNELQAKLIAEVLDLAKLTGPDQRLPAPVKVKHGLSNAGKRMHFYLNYSAEPQSVAYPYGAGTELTANKPVAANAALRIGAWDLAIVEER
jgi:beta-galactosidase